MAKKIKKNPQIKLSEEDRDLIEDAIQSLFSKLHAMHFKEMQAAAKAGYCDTVADKLADIARYDDVGFFLHDLAIDWVEPDAS